MTEDRGLRPGLFPDHLVEVGGPGAEHLPEVGAAEPALVAAAGLPHDVLERPAALAGERGQRGEGHALADAAGDGDGTHPVKRNRGKGLRTGDWGVIQACGR